MKTLPYTNRRGGVLRTILLAGAALLLSLGAEAQKAKLKLAHKSMMAFDYQTASEIYDDVLGDVKFASDTIALRNIAECEINLGKYAQAEMHLRRLLQTHAGGVNDMHRLAQVLKLQGKYLKTIEVYAQILRRDPADERARRYIDNPDFAEYIRKDSLIYAVTNMSDVNSPASDFAPGFFTSSKLIFSSSRGLGVGARHYYSWNNQPYLNVYSCDIRPDSTLSNVSVLPNRVNTRYHEGSMSYQTGDNRMYITRNNYFKGNTRKSKMGHLNLGIFSYKYSVGAWGDEEKFVHNNKEYSVGHPSVTQSGNRIYFVSNMPGGIGGTDIYYCDREGEEWSSPRNAGHRINTQGDEMFPFALGDSVLYFSSSGHIGLGGLDLYSINMIDTLSEARNLGYPISSNDDDFGIVVYPDERAGYFSSNRSGGKGDDDIYRFVVRPPDFVDVTGRVVEANSMLPLGNADVMVEAHDGGRIIVQTNETGEYTIRVPYRKVIRIEAQKHGYAPSGTDLATNSRKTGYTAGDIVLTKDVIRAVGKVIYDVDDQPAPGAEVRVLDSNEELIASTVVASDGTYEVPLPEMATGILEVVKAGYVKLTRPFNTRNTRLRKVENDFRLFKLEKGTVVRLDNIYYDYGMSDIRADAAFELDKLVQILNDNPTMRIELSSHTDSRGGDAFNLKLSDARAQSAVKYVISRGIDASRLVAKGYGETKLLNNCANNVNCSEEEHQFNRRTEFMILDI
jgi:outer membrane protein OmpA-like peptidoglycan-associated protein/tetratricopeptide (TPR) repeat protein